MRGSLAVALAEAGRADEARTVLRSLEPGPKDTLWIYSQCWALLAAARLSETELMIQLLPYRRLACVAATAVVISGSVAYFTGEAALALGDPVWVPN